MYIPKQFEVSDFTEIKNFVKEVASADFVTIDEQGQPLATLMPIIWVHGENLENAEYGKLIMHISRGNQQWKSLANGQRALAIVHGPQAYVTPNSYATKAESGKVVPTWNYTSVHFSGTVELTEDPTKLHKMVSDLTDLHEVAQPKTWKVTDAPEDFVASQLKAIVGITMHIEQVEAKAKLSQNRTEADRAGVIETLSASANDQDRAIAKLMSVDEKPNRLI